MQAAKASTVAARPRPPEASSVVARPFQQRLNLIVVGISLAVFLALSLYQLDLPGLYPDEAFDVIPTVQLLLQHPVELQRGAAIHIGTLSLPLMSSSDYQGVTSTYLALPFLAVGGINVYALRAMTVAIGLLALILGFILARLWFGDTAARVTVLLMAVSPAWIFWSRLGVYVVSEVVPVTEGALIALTLWSRSRPLGKRNATLYTAIFLLGLGLTTKLLYLWVLVALCIVGFLLYAPVVWQYRREFVRNITLWTAVTAAGAGAFMLGAFPFLLYNAMTRGTLYVLRAGSGSTEHGVNNSAFLRNLWTEADAFRVLLDGSYFWFQGVLGRTYANFLTPTLFAAAAAALLASYIRLPRSERAHSATILPTLILALAVVLSVLPAFTSNYQGGLSRLTLPTAVVGTLGAVGLLLLGLLRTGTGPDVQARLGVATLVAGAAWWFGGAGRPEGPNPGGTLGLWPIDSAGILFWVCGGALLVLLGWDRNAVPGQRPMVAALAFIGLVVGQSSVTVSGLWSTHLLLLLPLPQIIIGAFFARFAGRLKARRIGKPITGSYRLVIAALILPVAVLLSTDLLVDYSYHRDLTKTGGGSTFSDAVYRLTDYLQRERSGMVVAMDWGFKRPIQFLTADTINPVDAYGYTPEPTEEFRAGLRDLMQDPSATYLFHTPDGTAYPRYDAFLQEAQSLGKNVTKIKTFYHRDGIPVYLLYEVK